MTVIWIVDDDDEMTNAIRLMLRMLNYTVETFRNARGAVGRLQAGKRPDVMVLDINMPEVSGIDLLEFMRRREGLKEIPVVMLSSETTDVQVDEAIGLGADAFVFKPVTVEEMEAAILEALKKRGKKA
jgi:two-component system chemotaxis response regulator CheY